MFKGKYRVLQTSDTAFLVQRKIFLFWDYEKTFRDIEIAKNYIAEQKESESKYPKVVFADN